MIFKGAPRFLSGAFVSDGALTLTWAPPAAGTFSGTILNYILELTPVAPSKNTWAYGTDPEFNITHITLSSTNTIYTHPANQLYPFTHYSVRAAAETSTEGIGSFSAPVLVENSNSVPSGEPIDVEVILPEVDPLSFPPSAFQLIVSWSSPAGMWVNNTPITSFLVTTNSTILDHPLIEEVVVEWSPEDTSPKKFTLFLSDLNPHTQYDIQVSTIAWGGKSEPSSLVTARTRENIPKIAPQGISLLQRSPNSLTFSWKPVLENDPGAHGEIIGYSLYHTPAGDIDCIGISCEPPEECKEVGRCEFGECIYLNKANGSLCDDGNPFTENDICSDGICVGVPTGGHISQRIPSRTINVNTRSHGAAFFPPLKEMWFPAWTGTTVYRHDYHGNYFQTFVSPLNSIMGMWAEPETGFYYIARWTNRFCSKIGPYPVSTIIWSFSPPGTASVGGVSANDQFAYCMTTNSPIVYVLNKDTGQQVRVLNLRGGAIGSLQGSLAVIQDKLYYGTGGFIYRHNLNDGQFDGFRLQVHQTISNMLFTGRDICISNGASVLYCYQVRSFKSWS